MSMRFRARSLTPRRGFALVVVLSFVVLLTVVVLAFLSNALLQRTVADSSANQTRADIFAKGAVDTIIGDLKQEIANGSVNGGSGQTNSGLAFWTFTPSTNATVTPYRAGSDPSWTNVVKRSAYNTPFNPAGSGYSAAGPSRAANLPTTAASKNGRSLSVARWNKALLLPAKSATDLTPNTTTAFTAPDWILVNRGGGNPTAWNANLRWSTNAADTNSVVGRYAYVIYNEGALLDVNVAGYPDGLLPAYLSDVARKGGESYADLTEIGLTLPQIDTLVKWRNFATLNTSVTNYPAYVAENPFGFQQTANTNLVNGMSDRRFVSRQQLIDFMNKKLGGGVNVQKTLLYLGTFSPALNAPSWGPTANANTLGGSNTGADFQGNPVSYSYKDNADTATSSNRQISNVRTMVPFTRLDGSPAFAGEPLIKNRFDLGKLDWIRSDGTLPAGVTAKDVYDYFGLTRQPDGSWVYYHNSVAQPGSVPADGASRIMTLDQVANAGREPDYFELLQAGILQGALGLCSGDPTTRSNSGTGGEFYRTSNLDWRGSIIVRSDAQGVVYAQEKYQVIQIGANIIDQADTDGYPTEIALNGEHFYGIENLPYLNALGDTAYRPPIGGPISPNAYQAYVHRWLTVALWNPHQNAKTPSAKSPNQLRVLVDDGQEYPVVHGTPRSAHEIRPPWYLPMDFKTTPSWVAFNISDYTDRFSEPTTLDYDLTTVSDPSSRVKASSSWRRAGIYMGYSYSPDHVSKVAACAPLASDAPQLYLGKALYCAANMVFTKPLTVKLQFQDAGGNWHTYQEVRGLVHTRDGRGDPYMEPGDSAWALVDAALFDSTYKGPLQNDQEAWIVSILDPRTPRFNLTPRLGLRLSDDAQDNTVDSFPLQGPHFLNNPRTWSNWVNNSSTGVSYYTDRDSARRVGDAAGWTGANPFPAGTLAQRPLMLNRPFRSVGELGYVFRDDAWKTLNMMSTNSADSALLDLFTVGAVPASTQSSPQVVSGKVDLNTAPAPVLQALISGTARSYSTTITSGESQGIAADIINKIKTGGPLLNVSALPSIFPQDTSVSTKYPGNKIQREAAIRALADTGTTRTWNLLIDVVAQGGKYGPAAASLNDFIVEGEARYWVHVSIDRYTGEVVARQFELVSE